MCKLRTCSVVFLYQNNDIPRSTIQQLPIATDELKKDAILALF
jgi:hypothetical protein